MMAALVLAADFWIAKGMLIAEGARRAAAIHVKDGRIAALADAAPANVEVLDATGLFIVPAVVDAHVHLSVAGELGDVAAAERKAGIAAVLDLGEAERLLGRLAE